MRFVKFDLIFFGGTADSMDGTAVSTAGVEAGACSWRGRFNDDDDDEGRGMPLASVVCKGTTGASDAWSGVGPIVFDVFDVFMFTSVVFIFDFGF